MKLLHSFNSFVMAFLSFFKKVLPTSFQNFIYLFILKIKSKNETNETNKTNEQIFSEIYFNHAWGKSYSKKTSFFSGVGSHEKHIVKPYIESVIKVLKSIEGPKKVVDLGCGDFNIGSQLIEHTDKYIGCDVVPELIKFNRESFSSDKVTFMQLDIASDELPDGDIVIIRQVLQHLSNKDVLEVLRKVQLKYKHFIFTDHITGKKNFRPNLDIPSGAHVRADSAVVIEEPPFSFPFKDKKVLVKVLYDGEIRTTYYKIY